MLDAAARCISVDAPSPQPQSTWQLSPMRPLRPAGPWFFLHLFSGQRRPHDIQQEVEFLASRAGLPIVVISVDLALDATRCNLAEAEAIDFWLMAIRHGWVVGILAGPP